MTDDKQEHKNLAEALAAFQAEELTLTKNKEAKISGNFKYKYADLGEILPAVNPLLAKHGLSWSAKPGVNETGDLVLDFVLRHIGGDVDAGSIPLGLPRNCKPQELGSAITYMRRYALTAQLNIAADEDDDGQMAQEAPRTTPQPMARPAEPTARPATAAQRSLIFAKAGEKSLTHSSLANIVLVATGNKPRTSPDELRAEGVDYWDTEEQAESWLKRALDRLPASAVDEVLAKIEEA